MTRTILISAALASAVGLFALGANAQQQSPQPQRMSVAQIATLLEDQGYSILEIELERGRYDVEMIDGRGMKLEAYLDPTTGAVLPYRDHDDDDRHHRGGDDRYERDDD
jgi:hypothetical protein